MVEGATPAERLARQRRSLRKRLGMGGKMDEFVDTNDLIQDEDLLVGVPAPTPGQSRKEASTGATELLSNMEGAPPTQGCRNNIPSLGMHCVRVPSRTGVAFGPSPL